MAISYTIRAEVVDIRQDQPRETDIFFVDTNAWYWLFYERAPDVAKRYQVMHYPPYLIAAMFKPAKLCYTGISLAELSHIIEATEREIFGRTHGAINPKEYRHNLPDERAKVLAEIENVWRSIVIWASRSVDLLVSNTLTDTILNKQNELALDGYDLLMLEAMLSANLIQIITDAGDFATVPGIRVFTANEAVINAAREQGKLLKR
jgi:hypothetical protein